MVGQMVCGIIYLIVFFYIAFKIGKMMGKVEWKILEWLGLVKKK